MAGVHARHLTKYTSAYMLRRMKVMKRVRDILGVSQEQLAVIAGVSQATVSRWEAGLWEPNRDELERIRTYALSAGIDWEDSVFFQPPEAAE